MFTFKTHFHISYINSIVPQLNPNNVFDLKGGAVVSKSFYSKAELNSSIRKRFNDQLNTLVISIQTQQNWSDLNKICK